MKYLEKKLKIRSPLDMGSDCANFVLQVPKFIRGDHLAIFFSKSLLSHLEGQHFVIFQDDRQLFIFMT